MGPAYYYNRNRSYGSYLSELQIPFHLCFFMFILLLFLSLSWYLSYESALESIVDQLKLWLIVSPVILLLVVHWLSSDEQRLVPFILQLPEKDSIHRAGSSPWGVAFVLMLLLFMISYQSYFHERWFPLLTRS
ncbi:hypothetical protein AMTRI_Chr04g243600 [Amborella trichopoda]|uniref:Uncharacterized protein n=1 Tax=Amborella trichopoda TaxID=13333 RepID=W1PTK4_AMBTC|nr:hypothetical protein AMTR_s00024p00189140 [Amborella trichopoda]